MGGKPRDGNRGMQERMEVLSRVHRKEKKNLR